MLRILTIVLAFMPMVLYAQDVDTALREAELREVETAERIREAELRLEQAAQEIAELSSELAGESLKHVFKTAHHPGGPGRAMLGINVGKIKIMHDDGSNEESGFQPDGVEIYGVTPGGPAEEAGLQSGDVILALNGQRLVGHRLPPERRLIKLMHEVEPGETVSISYRRGDEERSAQVVTREFEHTAFAFGGPGEDFDLVINGERVHDLPELMGRFPGFAGMRRHGVWKGLELVPLTPKLGSYFGTDSGLLVVRAAQDDAIPLEEGDVIMQIAGATPQSPPEAMRLLRFYEPGDEVVIEVRRQKRNRTFKVAIPESES